MSDLLKNVRIASPCSVDWNTMAGDERIRHCIQCNLSVYNLSAMSEREVHQLVVDRKERMCVRFYRRQDGTVLTQNCPIGFKIVMRRVSRIAGYALSALMSTFPLAAQTQPSNRIQTIQSEASLDILVVDATGAICAGAAVELASKNYQSAGKTNNQGSLHLAHLPPGSYVLKVTLLGFEVYEQSVTVLPHKNSELKTTLQVAALQGALIEAPPEPISPVDPAPVILDFVPVPSIESAKTKHGFFRRMFTNLLTILNRT